jgi:voltage-dependent calcium channel alpha-2/delta-3
VSEDITTTGRFFGEVDDNAMHMLIENQVFRKIHIFDYQAICFRGDGSKSDASFVTKVS